MEFLAAEHPRRDSHSECTRTKCGQDHYVKGLPDTPAEGVVPPADRAESGQFAITSQHERNQDKSRKTKEESIDYREPEHGNIALPAVADSICAHGRGAHSCALSPVCFSRSWACCS